VADSSRNHDLVRRRHAARLSLLKRRSAIASVLGFTALFGLVAQHTVKGSSRQSALPSPSAQTRTTPTMFFDQRSDGFAFDDQASGLVGGAVSAPPPVTQTSVS
jgi:hypothetical protein